MLARIVILLGITLGFTLLSDSASARTENSPVRIGQKDKKDPPKEDKKDPKKEEKKEDKKDDKKDPPKIEDSWPKVKGTLATIIKVEADKKSADFKIEGKVVATKIGEDVKFVGPQGGEGDGFKDDRFVVGRNVKLVYDEKDKTKLKEIHLDYRPKKEKEKDKK